jgi:hypothetical protein
VRRAHLLDLPRHLGVRRDNVREDRDQPVAVALHLSGLHVEVEPRDELAVAAGGDEHSLADLDHVGQCVMRMRRQQDVDALDAPGELTVDVEAVVGQEHDEPGALLARLDVGLHVLLANAERPVRHHPARVGDGRVGEGLADHRDLDATPVDHPHRLEGGLVPLCVADVLSEEGEAEVVGDRLDALRTEREFPVPDHRIGLQELHAIDHVLALGDQV